MFVSVIFNVEYMDITSRKMWYLKNLFHCKENGGALVTHEYLYNHFEELQDSITDRFFDQFEMRRFAFEEIKDVEQYFVPDDIFDDLEQKYGSRTQFLIDLNDKPYPKLDKQLDIIFEQIKERHPGEKIEGIFHCLEGYESLHRIAKKYDCPLINYSFAAFRKVHGYRQTLYQAGVNNYFWTAKESDLRYKKFLEEDHSALPIFSNEEIIAMIGKEHTLPLIKLINNEPKYEMGICCECYSLLPQVYKNFAYTDDDIFYDCKRLFGSGKLKVRSHAAHLNDIQVDRSEVHDDPASFILSCKRLTAVQSQILLKVLLWKRTAVLKTDSLPFAYMCTKDFTANQPAEIHALNYYIFGYLIPSDLMFSDDYWKWRLSNPTETKIYQRHLDFLFNALGINKEKLMQLGGKDRFRYLLECRNCDEQLIESLLSDKMASNVCWDVASSRFDVISEKGSMSYWRIDTENEDGSLTTTLAVDVKDATSVNFFPLDDVTGFTRLKSIIINGKSYDLDEEEKKFIYMPKNKGVYSLLVGAPYTGELKVECTWVYKKVYDYLNGSK